MTLRTIRTHRQRRCLRAGLPGVPTLIVWGTRDAVVPYAHALAAHAAMPSSRLETFVGAGHFPHHADPGRFVALVRELVATTAPARWRAAEWRRLLCNGRLASL